MQDGLKTGCVLATSLLGSLFWFDLEIRFLLVTARGSVTC